MVDSDDSEVGRADHALRNVRSRWGLMTVYELYEQLVAIALSLIIAVLILIALAQLYERVLPVELRGALNPLDHEVFRSLFGCIFTLLIAMKFKTRSYWLLRDPVATE